MGKKSKFKKIRRLASEMPLINTGKPIKIIMGGEQLIKDGVKEVAGEAVDPTKQYQGTKKIPVPMNHNRRMKQMYYKQGIAGVEQYVNAVNEFVREKQRKATAEKYK